VTRMMERAGIAMASVSAPFGNDRLLEGHCGMSHHPAWSPRASVGLVTGMAGDRQRFTLAHEFGHVVLHSRRRVSEPDQREREADYFAGALLLPRLCAEEEIAESLTLGGYMGIKAKFGISLHAIIARAQRLGLITRGPPAFLDDPALQLRVAREGAGRRRPRIPAAAAYRVGRTTRRAPLLRGKFGARCFTWVAAKLDSRAQQRFGLRDSAVTPLRKPRL
jgi:IrrE N-terminal-like domain